MPTIAAIRGAGYDARSCPCKLGPRFTAELYEKARVRLVCLKFTADACHEAYRNGTVRVLTHGDDGTTREVFDGAWNSTLVIRFPEPVETLFISVVASSKRTPGAIAETEEVFPISLRSLEIHGKRVGPMDDVTDQAMRLLIGCGKLLTPVLNVLEPRMDAIGVWLESHLGSMLDKAIVDIEDAGRAEAIRGLQGDRNYAKMVRKVRSGEVGNLVRRAEAATDEAEVAADEEFKGVEDEDMG